MNIVLLEPEIPQNAGNISRTCAVTHTALHMIRPFGFSVEDKYLKRAGLDYWDMLDLHYYDNFQEFCEKNPGAKMWFATTKAQQVYSDVTYGADDYIVFGKESAGIQMCIRDRTATANGAKFQLILRTAQQRLSDLLIGIQLKRTGLDVYKRQAL